MGWYDYFTDLTSSLSVGTAYAEQDQTFAGTEDKSGEQSKGNDARAGGVGTPQHDRDATTRGGVSTKTPASGTDEESGSEKEANEQDAQKQQDKAAGQEGAKGHVPGDGGEGSGQTGPEASGPHGGHVKGADADESDEEEESGGDEEEEEEEEEDEPEDIKGKLEEDCMKTQQCAPLKHHYDECAERVSHQHAEHGKAHEDCVEEFFHLMHCATQCAAPKLFKALR